MLAAVLLPAKTKIAPSFLLPFLYSSISSNYRIPLWNDLKSLKKIFRAHTVHAKLTNLRCIFFLRASHHSENWPSLQAFASQFRKKSSANLQTKITTILSNHYQRKQVPEVSSCSQMKMKPGLLLKTLHTHLLRNTISASTMFICHKQKNDSSFDAISITTQFWC